jgi:hypothetical protein
LLWDSVADVEDVAFLGSVNSTPLMMIVLDYNRPDFLLRFKAL